MMKKIFLFLVNFFYLLHFAQATNSDAPYNVILPSPESYFKSKFGNTDINDFRGEPNVSIPLFSSKNGNLPIDIELKYIKAGVKIDDIPNSTGINWAINNGGIITRTINDIADEKGLHPIIDQLPVISIDNPQTWGAYVLQNNDHEVDIFNFTVGNYSGSFYLDVNFQPILLTKDHNCKVEVIGSFDQSYEFKITTYQGVVYNFGGAGFTEKTTNRQDPTTAGVTTFYLKTISNPETSKVITYEYEAGTPRSIVTGKYESYNSDLIIVSSPSCGGYPLSSSGVQQKLNILNIPDPKRLSRIWADDMVITFDYSFNQNLYDRLNSINIKNNDRLIKKYVLGYLDQKFFLSDVKFFENVGTTLTLREEYKLEYDNPLALPDRLSPSVDYLGYFNGKYNNLNTLIPNINLFGYTSNASLDNFADRRPVFELAKYGTLKSITYPTKGKTVFEYEPINEAPRNDEIILGINTTQHTDSKDLLPYHFFSGVAEITMSLRSDDVGPSPTQKAVAELQILDSLDQVLYSTSFGVSKITPNYSRTEFDTYTLDRTKKYKFIYKIKNNICSNCEGTVSIKFKKLDVENGAGIRLKKQFDITENDTVNIKRLYYTNFENIPNLKKDNHIPVPNFKTHFLLQTRLPNPQTDNGCSSHPTDVYVGSSVIVEQLKSTPNLSSLGHTALDLSQSENYFNLLSPSYSNITISFGGDHFEKGGNERRYYITPRTGIISELYSSTFSDTGLDQNILGNDGVLSLLKESAKEKFDRLFSFSNLDGKLLEDKLFTVQGNVKHYSRTVENTYTINNLAKLHNVLGTDIYPSSFGDPSDVKNKYITSYSTIISESFLSDTKITDFTNIEDPSKKIVTTVKNSYLNPQRQLSKAITVFPNNTTRETTYAYAHEKGSQLMIDRNMVGIPLETTTIQKQGPADPGKTIAKTEILYPTSLPTAQSGSLVLPLSVKSADQLTGVMSTDVTYDKYDEKGNIVQYTTKDGIAVTIVWGYNKTQPIAKIEGMTYDQLLSLASPTAIITASDQDAADPSKEGLLLDALNSFRKNSQLADRKVTTYTYDPLIGVTSITPPSGIRQVFTYDPANRLKETKVRSKDTTGAYSDKKASEYKYNYKP